MAKKIKDYYDLDCAKVIADTISSVWPGFNSRDFLTYLQKELPDKEFSARQDAYVAAFEQFLHKDYTKNIRLFSKILGPELQTTEGMFITGWWLWPIGRYVEKYGTTNPDLTLSFIYELTKRFTGEFAIRPLLEKYPEKTLKTILKWSKDPNVHVRRLASEGMRIRLPWAKKSLIAKKYFKTYKTILTNLKNAPEKFVQKSVGNNLNDLMKEEKRMAFEIISEWKSNTPTPATQWIIQHGRRSEMKKK